LIVVSLVISVSAVSGVDRLVTQVTISCWVRRKLYWVPRCCMWINRTDRHRMTSTAALSINTSLTTRWRN